MNKQAKQLFEKLWDYVDCQDDDGLYPVENLFLTKDEHDTLDKLVHTPDEPEDKSPWISCAEEMKNDLVEITSIKRIGTEEMNDRSFSIILYRTNDKVIWIFDTLKRRNEVYTKIYNRLHPEEL